MRVLGIDPGSRNTGLGVVEATADGLRAIAYKRIRMGSEPLPLRLATIYQGVQSIIAEFNPDAVAVEQVFISNKCKIRPDPRSGSRRRNLFCGQRPTPSA